MINKLNFMETRVYQPGNVNLLKHLLKSENWIYLNTINDLNGKFDYFYDSCIFT